MFRCFLGLFLTLGFFAGAHEASALDPQQILRALQSDSDESVDQIMLQTSHDQAMAAAEQRKTQDFPGPRAPTDPMQKWTDALLSNLDVNDFGELEKLSDKRLFALFRSASANGLVKFDERLREYDPKDIWTRYLLQPALHKQQVDHIRKFVLLADLVRSLEDLSDVYNKYVQKNKTALGHNPIAEGASAIAGLLSGAAFEMLVVASSHNNAATNVYGGIVALGVGMGMWRHFRNRWYMDSTEWDAYQKHIEFLAVKLHKLGVVDNEQMRADTAEFLRNAAFSHGSKFNAKVTSALCNLRLLMDGKKMVTGAVEM